MFTLSKNHANEQNLMGKIKIRRSDELFSIWIRTRDGWTCQRCGTHHEPWTTSKGELGNPALHCSHFQGRGKEPTRFDPENADALCYGCHQYFTSHPAEHYEWQVERKGQEAVDSIRLRSNGYKKRNDKEEKAHWKQMLLDQSST